MKFVRTLLIITALILGWIAIRADTSAQGLVSQYKVATQPLG